MTFEEFIRL